MSTVVRQLRRATTLDAQPLSTDPVDYCQCGRGPVVGIVRYNDRQLWFFSLESRQAGAHDDAVDLRCIDCLAEVALDIANGTVRERMKEVVCQRAEEMEALMRANAMRREAGLPIVPAIIPKGNEWPLTKASVPDPAQTSPTDGDQVT